MASNPRPRCNKCGTEMTSVECENCGGEGYSYHDCGEDTCCCLNPEPNVLCEICKGKGYWFICEKCADAKVLDELALDGRLF